MPSVEPPEDASQALQSGLQQLGRTLADARVSQGRTLEEQARLLHMGVEQLRCLEAADPSGLPELVYVIAQARRVASSLDLQIDDQIAGLRLCGSTGRTTPLPAPSPSPEAAPGEPLPAPRRPGGVASWLQPLAALALLAGLASAGVAVWRHGLPRPVVGSAPSAPASTGPQAAAPVVRPPGPAPVTPAAQVVLRSAQPSWLEVRTRKGQTLQRGLFSGQKRFPLQSGLDLRAGRPDLITVAVGAAAPRTLGRIEEVRWWRIQPNGRILALPAQPG